MAFDGSGVFLRLRNWIADATAGVKIRADFHDDEDNNFAAGLTNCITKDGQTTVTQNIPFNSKRITALADPIDPQDAATKAYTDAKALFTSDITIKNDDPSLTLDGKDGFKNSIYGDKGSKHRWEIVLGDATTEATNDVGSDFHLINYHNDGTLIGDVFFGTRSTGLMTVKGDPTAALGIATKQYVDITQRGIILDGTGFGSQTFASAVSGGTAIAYYHSTTNTMQTSTWDGFNLTVGAGEAGIWMVYAALHAGTLSTDCNFNAMSLFVGGNEMATASQGLIQAGTGIGASVAAHVKLAVGNKLQARFYHQAGSNVSSTPDNRTRFSAYLISRL